MTARQGFIVAAAVGSGLVGGVLFAFSTFVMSGLRRLPANQGIAAMQAINLRATTAPFMSLVFGTAVLAVGLGIDALVHRGDGQWAWVVAGSAAYLVAIVITASFHVPRNDALAALDPEAAGSAQEWVRYVQVWVAGNHVRTLACAIAAVAFTVGSR